MPDKTEKARRRQIQRELQEKAQAEFEKNFRFPVNSFKIYLISWMKCLRKAPVMIV